MARDGLLAAAAAFAAGDPGQAAQLLAAFNKAAAPSGKENGGEVREAALRCFKACQQLLAQPGDRSEIAQLAAVGRAALAALAAGGGAAPAALAQLQGWRYNFARRLVFCKAFHEAHAEAWVLFQQLDGERDEAAAGGGGSKAAASVEAANLAVGTVLTLVLCCVEGGLLGNDDAVAGMVRAVESLPPWLSQLKLEEAAKHGEAAYKYLYKAAVALLERRTWCQLAAVCSSMLGAAGQDAAAQQRAAQAVARLAGHMPEEHAAAMLAAVAARAADCGALGIDAALDLLSPLCSAVQRTQASPAAQHLRQAVLSCAQGRQPLLQPAALLLPALTAQSAGKEDGLPAAGWLALVSGAVKVVTAAIKQLEEQPGQRSAAQPAPADPERQLALLEAAFLPANTLRRVLAAQLASGSKAADGSRSGASPCQLLGGEAAAETAAAAVELLAGVVGVGGRHAAMQQTTRPSSLHSQGHAAAVGLATAARLRAACGAQQPAAGCELQPCSSTAIRWLLGWDLGRYCNDSMDLPPAVRLVEPQELSWLASALFNVGVDMHGRQQYQAAASAMHAALSAAAAGLRPLAEAAAPAEDGASRLSDFCRKCIGLSDAQRRAGDVATALTSLAHSTALLLQLGFVEPAAWRPLVQAFVQLQAELPVLELPPPQQAAPAATKRGRAASSRKGAPQTMTAAGGSSSSSSAGAAEVLLTSLLQQNAAQLPEGCLLLAAEQELQCWAAARQGGDTGAAAGAERPVRRLLSEVFPRAQHPVEHAGVLLSLHQLGLPADNVLGSQPLLERAVQVLAKARGPAAAGMLAEACSMLAVDSARQLAQQALQEQQQERQRSHAAASTSTVGSSEQDAAAVAQLASDGALNAAGWRRVEQQAQQALSALRAAGSSAVGSQAQPAIEELHWLLGLHGNGEAEQQLLLLLPAGSAQHDSGVLAQCLFPHAAASAAKLQQQADAAAVHGSRSGSSAVHRAALHKAAAEAHAAAGDTVAGLYHAAEAHRLLAVFFHGEDGSGSSTSSKAGASVGWWRLAAAYLGSLLQLGQLFEAAGLADEAVHALREGQRLAAAAGSWPLAAVFAAQVAHIYCNQGQVAAASQAVGSAEKQLEPMAAGSSLPLQYCTAVVQLARAQLECASSSTAGGMSKAAWRACQAAVDSCQDLAVAAAADSGNDSLLAWCAALHARAQLVYAEAAAQQDDRGAAKQHAVSALEATECSSTCSALRHQRAAALLCLGSLQAAPEQHLAVWGLGLASSPSSNSDAASAKGKTRRAPAKSASGRSRSKAAAASAAADDGNASADASLPQPQQLWQALELSRGQLGLHRVAAAALAEMVGKQGYLHLAAYLLHSSQGAAMRLQYQLVLFSRRQQLAQRQRRGAAATSGSGGSSDAAAQLGQLEELTAVLEAGLDWQLLAQLGGSGTPAPAPAARGRKGTTSSTAAADTQAVLAALEQQAQQQLQAWQASLPDGTASCSVSTLPSSGGGSLLISRLPPAGEAAPPPLLVAVPVQQLSASLSQHPIRALRMDDDADTSQAVSSVQSVLDEMQAVLEQSGRSMREMSTDTKEQQREWWRARVSLDDRLAALVKHLDSSWLGPWRCLLLGEPLASSGSGQAGRAAAQRLEELLDAAGQPASLQQSAILCSLTAVLAQHANGGSGMSPSELRQAAHQLCHAAGLACTQEQQHELAALLAAPPQQAAAPASSFAAGDDDLLDAAPVAAKLRKGGRTVKFADDVEQQPEQQDQRQEQEAAPAQVPDPPAAAPSKAGRGRRTTAAGRGRRAASASPAASVDAETAANSMGSGGGDASPIAMLGSVDSSTVNEPPPTAAQGGLCQVFGALNLKEPAPSTVTTARAGGNTTAHTGKHRSRLRMMQASTPGPATARKASVAVAATAPRAARELPLTVAKTAPPPAARPASDEAVGAATAPVLLVLDGALQALPWESAPGLLSQRLYRMPSLACAAATARRRTGAAVDLASTFYALNPSGDLEATQSAFQDWFRGMRGWQGKAGCAPTAAELAAALQSHQLFLYCGHGGGEQYISAAKLRSLVRCSAALLMGCSSGRLRAQQHYEPVGAVLAYLLAGCPAAVANLWDVTDRDIDRFSQAVLTSWISSAGAALGSGGSSDGAGADMNAAVAASRSACKLPHLVGAAPVCYGIPSRIFRSEA